MKFWCTSETSGDASNLLNINLIQDEVNLLLEGVQLDTTFLEWCVIFVCVSDDFIDFFAETAIARRKPTRSIEIRLQLNYEDVIQNPNKALSYMTETLKRSIEIMGTSKFKVSSEDQTKLLSVIGQLERKLNIALC